ncbi:glycosyltransferase family 59 protein [Aplosporella prunicola CBS 121167]|uniref:Dol-P-Glc:Glc(2)Man(9)GlcNAc(2)-PP-Dol alpha-1,2-glucosyltransferase n=1 Tax=Aplosporella prunicola CBS 121167 TaxID=1176127 RepID=A0A6A6BJ61_9PEZI|nr:glycosyltransferase family 59 protein [Aplosporella prunicola CBS 121167]KAF2142591.1 glycosyltransferase family 59 protein [Aplosporella prunicola CBS 121167]
MDPSAGFRILALAFVLLLIPSWEWLSRVSDKVPEPYLDEVFHVRQAQVYCAGDFHVWDPKITTPPGLYLLSYIVYRISGRCDIFILRALNCSLALFIAQASFSILTRLYGLLKPGRSVQAALSSSDDKTPLFTNAVHTALNICLFPPLFFFFGLYYTDVPSTLFVLLTYLYALRAQRKGASRLYSAAMTVLLGVVALFFRQTNIFWVAVFPAGLAVVQALRKTAPQPSDDAAHLTVSDVLRASLMNMTVYDKPVRYAGLDDYIKTIISLAIAALRYPVKVITAVAPYGGLIGLFGAFVAWNGGVVLGDKSNHIATIHTPQMLYIWPYIAFFSFPILLPGLLSSMISLLPQRAVPTQLKPYVKLGQRDLLPRVAVLAFWAAAFAAAVRFNTIVHSFTLADNRHYVFYVFRILRRHPATKYLAVPVYVLCAWAVIQALGSARLTIAERIIVAKEEEEKKEEPEEKAEDKTEAKAEAKDEQAEQANSQGGMVEEGCQASFVLVWLATTTLNLITAPLVEPRYFIIPWIMWRLHVPIYSSDDEVMSSSSTAVKEKEEAKSGASGPSSAQAAPASRGKHNKFLWLETAWFLVVNVVTGYIFLNWGYEWPQEPGMVQRFLW